MTDDDYDSLQAEYDLCGVDGRLRDFAEAVADAEREACARQMERLGAHEMAHCLRNGPAPLDDPDLNDQAADYIEQHSDPLMDRINRSGPFADAP